MLALIIIIILIVVIVLIFATSGYIFHMALNRYASKEIVLESDINNKVTEGKKKLASPRVKWLENNGKQIDIISNDNLKLHGYIVNNKSNDWVVLVHGFSSDHTHMINRGIKLYNMGFNILLVDLRGHGKSEGKYITMGIRDCHDIAKWCRYIVKKENAKSIGLFGVSMGAATVMMASSIEIPKQVKYIIEDCGYNDVWEELKYQLNNLFRLPAFPFLDICNFYAKTFAKFDFDEHSPAKALAKTNLPILMIHGSNDTFVPFYMLDKNYNSCNSVKEKLVVEKANHAEAQDLSYVRYWRRIEKFIRKYK